MDAAEVRLEAADWQGCCCLGADGRSGYSIWLESKTLAGISARIACKECIH